MNFQSTKAVSFFAVMFVIAFVVHAALAINFAIKGQYTYIVAFSALFFFVGVQLRKAFIQLKDISRRMDAILDKSK